MQKRLEVIQENKKKYLDFDFTFVLLLSKYNQILKK